MLEFVGYLDCETQQIPYTLHRSAKRKRTLEMQVVHPQGLKVTAPKRWGISLVKKMLEDKKTWIFKEWLAQSQNTIHYPMDWTAGEKISFLGEEYILDVSVAKKSWCELQPPHLKIAISKPEACLKKILDVWLKKQAVIILKSRCDFFAKQMNLSYQKLSVANQKSRWGSCSSTGDIRFNWRLILLPLATIDYVVVHELAHLVHLNHQPPFWKLVERYAPDYKQQRKALRQVAIGRFS